MDEAFVIGMAIRLVYRDNKFLKEMNEHFERLAMPKYEHTKEWKAYVKCCEKYLLSMKDASNKIEKAIKK